MASGRRENSSRDSNMQSEHSMETSRSSPLRSAALRPEGTEFRIAGTDYGGARQKIQPSSDPTNLDDKGIHLPLDKAVVEGVTDVRKEEEPINHQLQELERHVRVGLKQATKQTGVPTLPIFSSMGGGRNSASTAVGSGGAGSKKAGGDNLPKEFEYHEEDFMPLSAQSNASQHDSSLSHNKGAPSGTKAKSPSKDGTDKSPESAPYYGLDSTFFKQPHTHHANKSDAVDSPEPNLGTLFPEESASKKSHMPTFNNSPSAFKAPAHIANKPKSKHTPPHMAHTTPRRSEEPHTPEMNLGQLSQENEEPSTRHYQPSTQALPKSLRAHAFATPSGHDKNKAPIEYLDDVDDGPEPQLHSLSHQFFTKSPSQSSAPSQHSISTPIHQSAMPPVHHAPPAHHSAPEDHSPTEHITPLHRAGAPVHHTAPAHHAPTQVSASEVLDPMQHAHAAPIYHAPSTMGQPLPSAHHEGPSRRGPTQIETIHMPRPARTSHVPTEHHTHIETIHEAYHPEAPKTKKTWHDVEAPAEDVKKAATAFHPSGTLPHPVATSDSTPAPAHEVPNRHHVPALGKSYDEHIWPEDNDLAPIESQKDGAGLNAASFPSFIRHDAPVHSLHTERNHKAAAVYKGPIHAAVPYHPLPSELRPKAAHDHAQHTSTPKNWPNKRARKAAKKQEAARNLGVLGSISEVLVGRRKNSVSTPVMRLNEIFGEADGPIVHNAPTPAQGAAHGTGIVAPAVAVAADGIRNLLGAIHMPAIISGHPYDTSHHDEPRMASRSAHDTHVAGHSQHTHTPSKSAALKTPKVNLLLFPEEDASYPRGDAWKHENPAHPKSVGDITEIHYQLPSHASAHVPVHSRVPAAVIQAPAVHRSLPGHMHLDLHTHPVPHQPVVSAQSAHSVNVVHNIHPQHKHSNAASLKKPMAKLNVFPEEEANYPRGDQRRHENRPSRPLHTPIAVQEVPHSVNVVHSIHPQHKHSHAASLKKPKAKLNVFPEEEADYPRGDQRHHENRPSHPLHTPIVVQEVPLLTAVSRKSRRQRKNSKAAALKKATVPVGAFPEEEAEYPRGDRHHENTPSQPMHKPTKVQEVQLDAAHLHSHHDLHPTISESAAAAVSSGMEGIKAILGGIHIPAMSNPAAKATVASLGAAAAVREHRDHQSSNLPLMYGTPVVHAPAHASVHAAPVRATAPTHHDPHSMHTAAPLMSSHKAPAVVPIYIAEPVTQVHTQDPLQNASSSTASHKSALGEHSRHGRDIHAILKHNAPVSVLPPADMATIDPLQNAQTSAHAPHAAPGIMDIHGIADDEEDYFLADDIKSPHAASAASAAKRKSGVDLLILRHNAPVSVLPPAGMAHKASAPAPAGRIPTESHTIPAIQAHGPSASVPFAHAHVPSAPIPQARTQAPATVHSHNAAHIAAPLMGAAAAGVKSDEAIMMESAMPRHKEATPKDSTRAQAPAPAIPAIEAHGPSVSAPFAHAHVPSAPISQAHTQAPAAAHSPTAVHIAAPLMGAAAAGVKSDKAIVMESAMPNYKKATPKDTHHIPISAVAPVIPIKDSTHVQASAPALAPTAMKTATTKTPIVAPLPKDRAVAPDVYHKSSHTAAPDVYHKSSHTAAPDVYHKLSHTAAPAAATTILPEAKKEKDVPILETKKVIAPITAAVTAPPAVKAMKATTTTSAFDDPIVKPAEVKVAKPVVETAEPVMAAQAVKHEAPMMADTTVNSSTTKPTPVPAVRPVVAAAAAAPVVAAAAASQAHHDRTPAPATESTKATVTSTDPSVSTAQQVQQKYQQLHPTTASSTSNTGDRNVPVQSSSLSSTQQATTTPRHVDLPVQTSSTQHPTSHSNTNAVQPPPGYTGAIPAVGEGETVMWVKKVYTTQDFYDPEDEEGIDELGYRKDRDVSRYMHLPGMHAHNSNNMNTNNVTHVVDNTDHFQPQMQSTSHVQPKMQSSTTHVVPQIQTNTTQSPQVQGDAQFQKSQRSQGPLQSPPADSAQSQQYLQANNSEIQAQTQTPMTSAQIQTRAQNAQFQQQMQALNAAHQRVSQTEMDTAIARRPSQPQVHPNNPETRRQSQATFQQHLKAYRRRSSGGSSGSADNHSAGIHSNEPQHAAAQ
ncbi:hypothetical protein BGZ59_011750 [Podila verticillata]|nr:hypothetical protein BGZ59_011750 [Podila verticillata]